MNLYHYLNRLLPATHVLNLASAMPGSGTNANKSLSTPTNADISPDLSCPQPFDRLVGVASLDLMTIAMKRVG